ncbi:MAG: lamin tail domain-containing protein, partial [Flavobacteriales bacterium]
MKRQLLILGWITLCVFGRAQVVVNEFSFANYNGVVDFQDEDWVEFYNPTGAAVNIGGYFISDNLNNPTKWEIPAGTTVPANGFRCVLVSGTG